MNMDTYFKNINCKQISFIKFIWNNERKYNFVHDFGSPMKQINAYMHNGAAKACLAVIKSSK